MSDPASRVECTIPVLPVRDLARSIAFYTETLGFKLDWGGAAGSCICSVSRDGHAIMLSERTSIAEPAWVWLEVARSQGAPGSEKLFLGV